MTADERTPGQPGYGEQSPQDQSQDKQQESTGQQQPTGRQQSTDQQQTDNSLGGPASTGQASYGNSGETGSGSPSQNSNTVGQQSDLGQSGQTGDGRDTRLFQGSNDDMGSSGTGRTGIEGSMDNASQSASDLGGSTGRSGIEGSLGAENQTGDGPDASSQTSRQGSTDQDFADGGQGALDNDATGSAGTNDIEVERSQGRESDVEGSNL